MGAAIPYNTEYKISNRGSQESTVTHNFGVIFFGDKHYHELCAIQNSHSLMAVRADQTDQVTIPDSCKEVFTVDHDEQQWVVYEDPTKPGFPSNHLRDGEGRELTEPVFFLTPDDLRGVIKHQIFCADVDFGKLQNKIKASQALATEIATAMAVLGQLPGKLLPESLNNANPETLISLAERLGEISAIISPEGPEALENQAVMYSRHGAGLEGGAG